MMKKTLLALGATLILGSTAMAADTIRIGSEGAYAPWNYLDDSGKLAGFEIDLGMDLCKRAELNCEFVANEWDSIIPNLLAGNYDMIMAGMSITDERMETISFSADYYPPDPSRYAVAKGATFNFDDLKGAKIGAQGATIQADYVEKTFGANNTVLSFETPDQSVADLMAGNIDMLLADGAFLDPIIAGAGGAIEYAGPEVAIGGGVGIGMRKGDADLQAKMLDALAAAKADGTVDKLIAEYFEKGPFYNN